MKKMTIVFGSLLMLSLTFSCTKDYTCECTETETVNGDTDNAEVYTFEIKEASKRQAQFNCLSTEETVTATNYDQKSVRNCELK